MAKLKGNKHILVLLLMIVSTALIYFYRLGELPSVYVDEATVGYNAYSILQTGRDEFGKLLPIAFRFFGAYTPSLYVYLIIPFIKFFGLNALAIRALSALATLSLIPCVYLFVRSLRIYKDKFSGIMAAFLFVITPWVLFNSRLGYEVTLGYALFGWGSLLVWRGIKGGYISTIGLLLLSASTYTAHTERYLVPIFLLVVMVLFYDVKYWKNNKERVIKLLVLLLITQLPNLYLMTTNAFWVKNVASGGAGLYQSIRDFVSQYLTYMSPKELFGISSDINLQHTLPQLSLFYPWMIIPFLIGTYELFHLRITKEGKYLIVLLLTASVPGALSGHFISVQRVLTLIIPVILITTLGIEVIKDKFRSVFVYPTFFGIVIYSLILLWRSYVVFLPAERAFWWNYGYEELANITKENPGTTYLVDNTRDGSIYMLFLYYLRYSPKEFQKNFNDEFVKDYYTNPPFTGNYKIGNVEVRPLLWEKDIFVDQVLIGDEMLMSPEQAKEHFLEKVIEIKDPTGKVLLLGYKTNPEKKIEDNKRKMKLNLNR